MASRTSSSSDVPTPSISQYDVDVDFDDAVAPAVEPPVVQKSTTKLKSPSISPTNQLRVDFSVWRIIGLTVLALGVVVTVLVTFAPENGVTLVHFDDGTIAGSLLKTALDRYNTKLRNVVLIVNKALDFVLHILAAIAWLGLFAKWSTREQSGTIMKHVPALAAAGLSFLVCNGPASMNVQVVPGELTLRMAATDLVRRWGEGIQPLTTGNGTQLLSAWNESFSEFALGNSVLNTVLRTKFVPFQQAKSRCKGTHLYVGSYGYPTMTMTIPSEDWVVKTLPAAIPPTKSFVLYPFTEGPMTIDNTTARTLFSITAHVLSTDHNPMLQRGSFIHTFSLWRVSKTPEAKGSTNTTYNNMLDNFSNASYLQAASEVFAMHFLPISNDAQAAYHEHRLADSITFTSLTVTFSLDGNPLQTDDSNEIPPLFCSEEGCLMPNMPVIFGTNVAGFKPLVAVAGFPSGSSENKTDTANSSQGRLVVLSMGKRLTGERVHVNETSNAVAFTGLRMNFTITVGILSWQLEDLGQALGAMCDSGIGCVGLRVVNPALVKEQLIALVGRSELEFSELDSAVKSLDTAITTGYPYYPRHIPWSYVLTTSTVNDREIVFPRNFRNVSERVAPFLASQNDTECNAVVDKFIKGVERNHLYMESSLQLGYTLGLHYLLQNAVVRSRPTATRIEFKGNVQDMLVIVSIPYVNAITSLAGGLVLIGICVAIVVVHKHGKSIIETTSQSSPTVIAQAMLNESKYPRTVLSLWLDKADAENQVRRIKLDEAAFESVVFRDKPKPSKKASLLSRVKPAGIKKIVQ